MSKNSLPISYHNLIYFLILKRKLNEKEKAFKRLNDAHRDLIDDFEKLTRENINLKSTYEPIK